MGRRGDLCAEDDCKVANVMDRVADLAGRVAATRDAGGQLRKQSHEFKAQGSIRGPCSGGVGWAVAAILQAGVVRFKRPQPLSR
jgi:hypothetical protein